MSEIDDAVSAERERCRVIVTLARIAARVGNSPGHTKNDPLEIADRAITIGTSADAFGADPRIAKNL